MSRSFLKFTPTLLTLFYLTNPMFAKVLVKRQASPGIQKVLQDFTTRLNQLEDTQQEDRDSLDSIRGFFNAIGVGKGDHNPCGGGGWIKFETTSCIKVMPNIYTMDEADTACEAEYSPDSDLHYPSVFAINSAEEQNLISSLLKTKANSFITGIWLSNNISSPYANWGVGSPTNLNDRNCVELRNDGQMSGVWLDVTCDRKNSIICRKSVTISYLDVIKELTKLDIKIIQEHEEVVKMREEKVELNHKLEIIESSYATLKQEVDSISVKIEELKKVDNSPPPQQNYDNGINWAGKTWAMGCDFVGNDAFNVRLRGEECGGHCWLTTDCTHFSWTDWTYDGQGPGTCWMKRGQISKNDAIKSYTPNIVCGFIQERL